MIGTGKGPKRMTSAALHQILQGRVIETSAPCRIDMGGTLDISTFYYPLRHLGPCTVNMAIGLRTCVRLKPHRPGYIKISSRGFRSAEFASPKASFAHPLGLMFAVAAFFGVEGVHIQIDSASPPRSALGGSSAAAVALIAALIQTLPSDSPLVRPTRRQIAELGQALEASVAGVPCGFQDQLAAVYGGVHAWRWYTDATGLRIRRQNLVRKAHHRRLEKHLLLAYCGVPHESKDINGRWVQQFLAGRFRRQWAEVIECVQRFAQALGQGDFVAAAATMQQETALRRAMTPDVLDRVGGQLVAQAEQTGCGARFTGAGGGGCLWALGPQDRIDQLRVLWQKTLQQRTDGRLLKVSIDAAGLQYHRC